MLRSVLGIAVLLLGGCDKIWNPYYDLDSPIQSGEVEGTWVMLEYPRGARFEDNKDIEITLQPEGRMQCVNFPVVGKNDPSQIVMISSAGKWKMENQGDNKTQSIEVFFDTIGQSRMLNIVGRKRSILVANGPNLPRSIMLLAPYERGHHGNFVFRKIGMR